MRAWVVSCLLGLMALAGCFGGDDGPVDQMEECPDHSTGDDAMMESHEPEGNSTSDDGNASERLALQSLRQAENGTGAPDNATDDSSTTGDEECPGEGMIGGSGAGVSVVASPENGTVPFNVSFSLDAFEVPLDANLTWTLDVDGDGADETKGNGNNLPGVYNFTYTFEGTYLVTFTATDGTGTWNDTTTVVAMPGEEEEPPVEEPGEPAEPPFGGIDEQVFVAFTCGPACTFAGATSACIGFSQAHVNGIDCGWVEIPPSAWGQKFTINSDFVEEDPDAAALTSCDAATATQIDSYGAGGGEAGTIPIGTGCLIAWEFTGPASTLHFVVESAL